MLQGSRDGKGGGLETEERVLCDLRMEQREGTELT